MGIHVGSVHFYTITSLTTRVHEFEVQMEEVQSEKRDCQRSKIIKEGDAGTPYYVLDQRQPQRKHWWTKPTWKDSKSESKSRAVFGQIPIFQGLSNPAAWMRCTLAHWYYPEATARLASTPRSNVRGHSLIHGHPQVKWSPLGITINYDFTKFADTINSIGYGIMVSTDGGYNWNELATTKRKSPSSIIIPWLFLHSDITMDHLTKLRGLRLA